MEISDRPFESREVVFDELERLGVVLARCHYYGGHDEGFVEQIELFKTMPARDNPLAQPDLETTEYGNPLGEALARPIYDELGEAWYDGTDDQDGYLYWNVDVRTVTIEHSYLDWVAERVREVIPEEEARKQREDDLKRWEEIWGRQRERTEE